jgi:hypothetical protein
MNLSQCGNWRSGESGLGQLRPDMLGAGDHSTTGMLRNRTTAKKKMAASGCAD